MNIDTTGLSKLAAKLQTLTNKKPWTKQDEQEAANLRSLISAVKAGASLADLAYESMSLEERRMSDDIVNPTRLSERELAQAKMFRYVANHGVPKGNPGSVFEFRDEGIGSVPSVFLNGSLGSFVPVEYLDQIFAEMKYFDPLVNPDVVNYVETKHGNRPINQSLSDSFSRPDLPIKAKHPSVPHTWRRARDGIASRDSSARKNPCPKLPDQFFRIALPTF